MSTWTPGITVIIPTFKRPIDLDRCLAALEEQSLKPAEILIAYRAEDEATQAYLARQDRPGLSARLILCDRPGQVYAMTVGIDNVRSAFFGARQRLLQSSGRGCVWICCFIQKAFLATA